MGVTEYDHMFVTCLMVSVHILYYSLVSTENSLYFQVCFTKFHHIYYQTHPLIGLSITDGGCFQAKEGFVHVFGISFLVKTKIDLKKQQKYISSSA